MNITIMKILGGNLAEESEFTYDYSVQLLTYLKKIVKDCSHHWYCLFVVQVIYFISNTCVTD